MERLIWQPGCQECQHVEQRLRKRPELTLVASNFPRTFPHSRHSFTVIRADGTAATGDAADALVREWTRRSRAGVVTAFVLASTIGLAWLFLCAVGMWLETL